ncbi:MAG: LacI family DNA-binding transcriptional regulator [Propionibacteriaceae bacterium]
MVATYKDIRRLTGLSLATISKFYNGGNVLGSNRELIERAASDLGFQINDVARGLRSRRSMTVGVVLDQLSSAFNATIVSCLEERLREAGYGTIICDSRNDMDTQSDAVRFLIGKMVDGIVIVPVGDDSSYCSHARQREVPIVAVDRLVGGLDSVVVDNRRAIAAAVELLLDAGHTEIGLLAGPDSMYPMRERRVGFRDAIKSWTGLLPRAELVAADPVSVEGGYAGLKRQLGFSAPPTAVVCANYELTLGATIALTEICRETDPPALVGFDNGELARLMRPRPTLVAQPVDELASQAASLLLKRLSGQAPDEPVTIILDAELVVGHESTYALKPRESVR